jgi:predicted O-methyltransferase YrrM
MIRVDMRLIRKFLSAFLTHPLLSLGGACHELAFIKSIVDSHNYRFIKAAPPGHYYSPIPDLNDIWNNAGIIYDPNIKEIPGIDINHNMQLMFGETFVSIYNDIPFKERYGNGARYHLDNPCFSYGDAVSLYSMLRLIKPKRIIEIGSGYSSAAMLDVNEQFFDNILQFTFIDPYPERLLGLLYKQDLEICNIIKLNVQNVKLEVFAALQDNDVLFIDSSHVAKTYSDINYIMFNILPFLNKGVVIHFHDIFWPFEYPRLWLEQGRAWNEVYFVRAFLQYNPSFEILFFNSYMEANHRAFLEKHLPLMLKAPSNEATLGNSSLWIRKVNSR